jgi:hypothetical protein
MATSPIRTVPAIDPATSGQKELVRLSLSVEGILAVWNIPGQFGGRTEVTVEVSASLAQAIMARPTLQTILDQLRDDTSARAILS